MKTYNQVMNEVNSKKVEFIIKRNQLNDALLKKLSGELNRLNLNSDEYNLLKKRIYKLQYEKSSRFLAQLYTLKKQSVDLLDEHDNLDYMQIKSRIRRISKKYMKTISRNNWIYEKFNKQRHSLLTSDITSEILNTVANV